MAPPAPRQQVPRVLLLLLGPIVVLLLHATLPAAEALTLAGVPLATDVTPHALIDRDVQLIQQLLSGSNPDFSQAQDVYQNGRHSVKRDGEMRTIAGFSKDLGDEDKTYQLYKQFFNNDPAYANTYIMSAFAGTGDFAGVNPRTRASAIKLAINVLNIWSYTINEIEDAWIDCNNAEPSDNIGAALSADEGWAFYTGSLEGELAGGNNTGVGLFRLAVEMCLRFGTCFEMEDRRKIAPVNNRIAGNITQLIFFSQSEPLPCPVSRQLINNIIISMKIPLVQKFIFTVNDLARTSDANEQAELRGELWTLRQAVAPLISRCAPSVVDSMDALKPGLLATSPLTIDQAKTLTTGLEQTYLCLGITCRDVGAAFAVGHSRCNERILAGYSFRSNVMDRAFIDLDIRRIMQLTSGSTINPELWAEAKQIYQQGLSSIRADGRKRTLAEMSRNDARFSGEPIFEIFRNTYGSGMYADAWITAAFDGTTPFNQQMTAAQRREGILKGIIYQTVWYYIIHELEEALDSCKEGLAQDIMDGDFVHDVDEAWAFYTGSSLWAADYTNDTLSIYSAAVRRCGEFGTCTNQGTRAAANDKILAAMVAAQASSSTMDCATLEQSIKTIKAQMLVPIIQGTIRYFYLMDPKPWNLNLTPPKEWTEGGSFYRAIHPLVAQCDASVANLIDANTNVGGIRSEILKSGYKVLAQALQSVYPCLGLKCADIGTFSGMSDIPCVDPVDPFDLNLAGYSFLSDVTDRMRIDLDLRDISAFLNADNFVDAKKRYLEGLNSVRSSGTVRTLADLSTNYARFDNESTWLLFKDYYKSNTYAHDIIMRALDNKDIFSQRIPAVRKEVALKGMQYLTIFNYILHEMEEAIETCHDNLLGDQSADGDDAVDVDEAWGFFVGSLHQTNPSNTGFLMYQANLKRCPEFKTCTGSSNTRSRTNDRTLALFVSSQAAATVKDCKTMEENLPKLRSQMIVPIVQGLLKYAYLVDKTDPKKERATSNNAATLYKELAEGHVFALAVLPLINQCDPQVAKLVNESFALDTTKPVAVGWESLTKAIQSTFPCLGITCLEVGAYVSAQQCQDADLSSSRSNNLSDGAIAGIVIAVIVAYLLSLAFCYYQGRKSGRKLEVAKYQADGIAKADAWRYDADRASQQPTTNGDGQSSSIPHEDNIQVV